jgi:hypothetical protein
MAGMAEAPGVAHQEPRDRVTPTATRSTSMLGPRSGGPADLVVIAESGDRWWTSVARRAIDYWASAHEPFQAFDLTELGVPAPPHPAYWGSVFAAAQADGAITAVRVEVSRRPSRNGGTCHAWVGIPRTREAAAA